MSDPITYAPDTSANRERLQERLATAGPVWEAYTTARDRVATLWEDLQDTPADLWPARTLALVVAHAAALKAARAWDAHAATLVLLVLGGEGMRSTRWADMAAHLGMETDEWMITTDPHDYTAPHVRGPLGDHATQTHRAHLEHLAAVRDLLNLGGAR